MKKILLLSLGVILISCEKNTSLDLDINIPNNTNDFLDSVYVYDFKMTGRTYQDSNGYYHLSLIEGENQTTHRFGAYVTNIDKWGLPTQVFWECENEWVFQGFPVPIVNGSSYADPNLDSVYSMMAPIWDMVGDTALIKGQAWFEEGDIILKDSINIIFE